MHKSILRNKLHKKLGRLSEAVRRKKSARIRQTVLKCRELKKARTVMAYLSFRSEVETWDLIRKLQALRKRVVVPYFGKTVKDMKAVEVRNLKKDLKTGLFGISVPRLLNNRVVGAEELDLILVPGLGFDRQGRRLGRGQGYYDRYLGKAKSAVKLGLAFREQIVKKVPTKRHDIRMNRVITD